MATFDYAVKWLQEGKAVIRKSLYEKFYNPDDLSHTDTRAIWWDPSSNSFFYSRYCYAGGKNPEIYGLEDWQHDNGWEFVCWSIDDFTAIDWMIYPHHASESDAWLDGDLDTEVELVRSNHG